MKQLQLAAVALATVNLGGALAQQLGPNVRIDANSINDTAWTPTHGKAIDGTQVNSASFVEVGESVIIRSESGEVLGMETPELEVFAAQFAQKRGYKVTPPAQQ